MIPPCPDSRLEIEYTAGLFPWTEYVNGLDCRYTQLLSFKHFKSLHKEFRVHLRLLFNHLNDLPRTHSVYINTNMLPTAVKAKKILDGLPQKCYEMYRIAVKISSDDIGLLSFVKQKVGLRDEWDTCFRWRRNEWRRFMLIQASTTPTNKE
jgi:hypothetical protein